jgi:hypothetical protein
VEIIAKFSMTQKLNKEPCWLLCDEQRFISGEISHPTKKRACDFNKRIFVGGGKKISKSAIFRGEKGQIAIFRL